MKGKKQFAHLLISKEARNQTRKMQQSDQVTNKKASYCESRQTFRKMLLNRKEKASKLVARIAENRET